MHICLAAVCKWSVYKLKLNYLGHRFLLFFSCHEVTPFRLFQRCQWLLSWLFCSDWWLTMCFLSLYSTNKHKQSQWRDCSGSNKSEGWECSSPCGTPERADEGGVPGKGPAAEGTKRGWPQRPGFLSSAAASSRWIWMKEISPFCPDTSVQFLSELIQGGNKQGKPANFQAHGWELSTGRVQRGSGINWTLGTKCYLVGS